MNDRPIQTVWSLLDENTKIELARASGISLQALGELSTSAEKIFQECRRPASKLTASGEVGEALSLILEGLQHLVGADQLKLVHLLLHLQSFLHPYSYFRARKQVLAMISDIDTPINPKHRGKRRVDTRKLFEPAEAPIHLWAEYTRKLLGRGKNMSSPIGFYSVLLPTIQTPGNQRKHEADWEPGPRADPDDWSVSPHRTIAVDTFADEVLAAMPRAIRRISRNARDHK